MKIGHIHSGQRCLASVLLSGIMVGVITGTTGGLPPAGAQEPAKVGPSIYKLKLQNPRVRVFEVTFKAGQKIGMHSHPDHVAYVLTPGTLKIMEAGKKPVTLTGKAGDTFFLPAQKHAAQNVGKTTLKILVVELRSMAVPGHKKP